MIIIHDGANNIIIISSITDINWYIETSCRKTLSILTSITPVELDMGGHDEKSMIRVARRTPSFVFLKRFSRQSLREHSISFLEASKAWSFPVRTLP